MFALIYIINDKTEMRNPKGGMVVNEDIFSFFGEHMDALPLYEAFESRVMKEIENVRIKV